MARMGTDTQPNAIIMASVILFMFKNKRINAPIIILWVLFILSLLLIYKSNVTFFIYVKTCLNYLSPALISFAAYTIFTRLNYKVSYSFFMTSVLIYMCVGLIQLYLIPDFFTFLVNGQARGILEGGRGVVSLAPEPAFYGSMCLFLIVFSLISYTRKQNLIAVPILFFQMLFISRSATALVILLLSLLIFGCVQLLKLRVRYLAIGFITVLLLIPVYNSFLNNIEGTRIASIYESFIDDPLLITKVDQSVGIRFTGAVAPFLALKENNFLPMGLGYYKPFLRELYISGKYRSFLTKVIVNEKIRLGGSANMILFQFGFIGFLFLIAIYLFFKPQIKKSDAGLYAMILFTCILFTQIQLMHSMIGLIMAAALIPKNKAIAVQ